jgi:hypothetical protein
MTTFNLSAFKCLGQILIFVLVSFHVLVAARQIFVSKYWGNIYVHILTMKSTDISVAST